MGVSVNGLGSGMDITSIITSLMNVEALPQQQLKQASADQQSMITALQGLNTKASALGDLATKISAPGATNLFTATTDNTAVTATAGTTATAATFNVTINQLAQTQVDVTAAMASWPTDSTGAPSALTLVDSTGKQTQITPASTSLDDVVTAINASGGPAKALKVASGTDASGNPLYRLQLTATQSGAAGAFTAYQGTSADVSAGTATDLMSQPGSAVVTSAQDAKATLYAGTAAQQTVTSATNTFTNLLPGVNVTASAGAVGSSVAVSVASDAAGISKQASDLVASVNDLLNTIASNSQVTTTSSSSGVTSASGGLFTGDSSVRAVGSAITDAVYMPTSNGQSPSQIGIVIQRDGTFTFDSAKFSAALAADPAGTQAALAEIAGRVATAATNASDPVTGSITSLIAGRQSAVNDLGTQISDWDQRLADRRASLTAVYNAMDTALGTLKSQQSWLTSQIAGLPTYSQSSK
ncbi:flagellar filament capping protein FliD [Sinomonas atrocyanea]|uniref:flagellar filament capping protein FliD n=1 Tax=Sinomonas atrocyanea TaxID=37927 RepID=UPI00277FA33E|nr:flagellar filament capping protein FliD [Sinomonas atrocyanea]MDQ0261012.1 flagellar hook-associated protein 2 [Sinomonas atrocyanea]MDR6622033.1 flagellar hook-associated protein 2 [Sinomonas atrocyanea]